MEISEQHLLSLLSSGDKTAARALYDKYVGCLTAVCSRYVVDKDDVKDLLQEVFIKIFTQINTFRYRGEGSLKAWMTRVAVNVDKFSEDCRKVACRS